MCQFKSGICVYLPETQDMRIYTSKKEDSHTEIRREHGLRDGAGDNDMFARYQTPVEFIPVTSLTDIAGWKFIFDAGKPDWWEDWMTEKAKKHLFTKAREAWSEDGVTLTSTPEGVTLSTVGNLDLGTLTSIPAGVTLSAGGYLDLESLTSIPDGVTLSSGGDLYLESLTSIPEGVTVKCKGRIFLKRKRGTQ